MGWKSRCCRGGGGGGGDLLCLLVLGLLLPACRTRVYTNHWAVRITGGLQEASRIASKYGYVNIGQIGTLKDYYHFYHSKTIKRSVLSSRGTHSFISMEPKVEWIQQQVVKRRIKRDYKAGSTQTILFNDPKWPSMWYMHCNDNTHNCQSDMNIVGAWKRGYTGKNVVVTILDDGIERNHPDLIQNYDPYASFDVNGNDYDPMPRYDASNENKHGTRCAGEVAATANNSHCVVGIAYTAKIGGVRMLDGDVTDMVEAKSLSLNPQYIHIYSASWGPDDDGKTVDGPASLARQAFENGIRAGRRGLGSIYVWASGNGGRSRDHCSCDGYTNSIYTISISSTAESGKKPWYLEECASTLATTYSSGESYDRKIITTDLRHRCTDSHTGTSASAPMAAGIIALALEANPFLTWRDVQHIIVRTSRAGHLNANDWKTNAAGYKVSHLYGFGLMDAEAMVIEAEKWTRVPQQHVCVENIDRQIKTIRPEHHVRSIYKATGCADNPNHHVIYLEHVVVRITITHPRRGDLAIYLTSPSGTRSQLLANRLFDHSMEGFKNWEFMTTHCWSEKAAGDWILEIFDTPSQLRNFKTPGKLKEWSLVLYGTSIQPYSPRNDFPKVERVRSSPIEDPTEDYGTDDYSGPCNAECSKVGCDGPGPDHCNDCLHYYYKSKNNTRICVPNCPPGHYTADKKRCKKCSPNCETCIGSHSDQCVTCKSGYYLNEETNTCITNCPDGFYLDKNKIVCRKCSENCKTCVEFQTCTECRHGLSLHGSRCAIRCEDGKFHSGRECEPCHRSCATCAGAGIDACINCTDGYFLEDGRCVQSCSTGYYLDHSLEDIFKNCKRCDASCLNCNGQGDKNCTSCPSGYILDAGVCVAGTVCKDGEYADHLDQCQFCDASCSKCIGPEQNDCIGCPITRFFDGGRCVLKCPKGKFEFKNQCHLCHHTCLDCSGSEPNKCTVCGTDKRGTKRFLYIGECRESCPPGHYHSEDNTCIPCSEQCEVCLDSTHCKRCFKGYYLDKNKCQKHECREGEVEDPDSEECVPCADGCRTCNVDDPKNCTSCIHNYYMYKQYCYKNCPGNTYTDEDAQECMECASNCDSCDLHECLWCNKDFYLSDGMCVKECKAGFYGDSVTGVCEACHKTCATCEWFNYDDCTSCKKNFQIYHGRCVNPDNEPLLRKSWNVFLPYTGTPGQNEPCDSSCKTCSTAANVCTSCPKGTFLSFETCVKQCPQGTFANLRNGKCENCTDNCENCSEPRHCLKCYSVPDQLFYLHEGRCLQECPEGHFAEADTCNKCNKPCKTCMGDATKCLSCESPLLLEHWECKPSCSERHFATDGTCKHCPEMCQECIHEHTCKACIEQFFLHNGRCLQDCPSGFYAESNRCFSCNEDCKECDGPDSDDCTECAISSFVQYNGGCFKECPEGTYYEEGTEDCQECNRTCQTCSSSTDCLTCREGFVMNRQGYCMVSTFCSLTEYQDQKTHTCKPCHEKCFRCIGPTEDLCLSCSKNRHLLNTTCVEACPDGYYVDSDEGRCFTCHSTCQTCNGKHSTQCLSCKPGWYKQGDGCVEFCPVGYYASNSTGLCQKCNISCKECLGPQPTDCLSCDAYFFLLHSKNECLRSCPEYYYGDRDTNTCERCHPTCSSCDGKGALRCTACVWNYHLAGGICYSECFAGEYKVQEGDPLKCDNCHDSCIECKGPGPYNCTICPANMRLYLDESRCVECCGSSDLAKDQDCCDCSEIQDECVLQTSLNLPTENKKKTALFVITSILLILIIGAIAFIWRRSRAKLQPVNKGGYEKLTNHAKTLPSYKSNHYENTSYQEDRVIEFRDRDDQDEDDDDDDIVYMGQDGTVYRKFKYGLLEDDEEDELEYDDESYSFR
ncbi:PREDICTED: proprotein convertase subtilisin/kexin type 5 isoform X4 [Crocodylus porosus]|uniref:proprotein convertase subtilisin/kexin type 5 isoform X4 n=1 Tax=Crocodylus porosus TaxID=8502 RepID=UPI00093A433A|nr:PREDICTED: proprotein convertase subtilisin/kexin type 5 isoform X4 [Crocodylus porosus]